MKYNIILINFLILDSYIFPHGCVDVVAQKENYEPDYAVYHNVTHLIKTFKELEKRYRHYVRVSDEYVSRNGVTQLFTRVTNFSDVNEAESKRLKILFAFGEHAREFLTIESLVYFLKNVTLGTEYFAEKHGSKYSFSTWILSYFDIYIVALTNPDGRLLIEKTRNYCWRGTANGVDLNRNFDWNYGKDGSSSDPKDDEYRGTHAFSEPETLVFQHLINSISFDAFVSFHSGVRHIYIPFADSHSKLSHRAPKNQAKMMELARILASSAPLRPFRYGTAHKLNGYCADGTSFDYMSGVAKIPFSFAIELWQHARHMGRSCFDEFNPHSNNLQIEVALLHPLYVQFLSYLYHWKWKQKGSIQKLSGAEMDGSWWQSQVLLLAIFMILFICLGTRYFFNLRQRKKLKGFRILSSPCAYFRN